MLSSRISRGVSPETGRSRSVPIQCIVSRRRPDNPARPRLPARLERLCSALLHQPFLGLSSCIRSVQGDLAGAESSRQPGSLPRLARPWFLVVCRRQPRAMELSRFVSRAVTVPRSWAEAAKAETPTISLAVGILCHLACRNDPNTCSAERFRARPTAQ
jgi:hypothetical protein